jgi:hypothetical protein
MTSCVVFCAPSERSQKRVQLTYSHLVMQLEAEASSVKGGQLSDMEREQYQNQIKDLIQAVETLLKSNRSMGERVAQLEKVAEAYDDLKTRYDKLEGELAMRKRGQHGKKSEKCKDTAASASEAEKTKDEDGPGVYRLDRHII